MYWNIRCIIKSSLPYQVILIISIALCPDLSDPANGMVSMTGNSAGNAATYTCDAGYELIGSKTVTCMDDGTWNDGPPMCRRKQFILHNHCMVILYAYTVSLHVHSL